MPTLYFIPALLSTNLRFLIDKFKALYYNIRMSRKTLYFDSYCGYTVSAITEGGKLTEFDFEKTDSGNIVGNIYKGRVESVLQGMQAAFINCGLERNCYLSAENALPEHTNYSLESAAAPDLSSLKVGDEIIVQVVKPPVGRKGAKVTVNLSFIGKMLIYLPRTPFIGVSRKIDDEELRRNLEYSAKRLKSPNEGLIVRTAAPYAKRNQLEVEFQYLKNLYAGLSKKAETAMVGELLYTDFALPVRVLRDVLSKDIDSVVVGNEKLLKVIEDIVNLYPVQRKLSISLHEGNRDMLNELCISEQIYAITSPKVALDSGAYLVIEKTEALTVIDVNTGKFTGDYNLEQTVYHTNILAAREIARQVKLRNIGGIVVVDFIDMQNATHKKALVDELERAFKGDSAKCVVSPMSKFGLVEFTRKRQGTSPVSQIIRPCRSCNGTGTAFDDKYVILGMRAKLLDIIADGAKSVRIDLNAEILEKLSAWREFIGDLKERCGNTEIYAVPHRTFHPEQINYRINSFDLPDKAVKIIITTRGNA